jgi:hypothetical protein
MKIFWQGEAEPEKIDAGSRGVEQSESDQYSVSQNQDWGADPWVIWSKALYAGF